jgi:biopolymer transport protein TolQ
MGYHALPIFLQVAENFTELIANAGALAKSILIILLVLSVVSWTIMVEKFRLFRSCRRQSRDFLESFRDESSLDKLATIAEKQPLSAEGQIVSRVSEEMKKGELESSSYLDNFLESQVTAVVSEWESYLIFLATTATISPFLGLLGTVWGIMSSFLSMGVRGSANLYVVGPGIAEALITTIFGLGAAIPAVVGYNYIIRVIRRREDGLLAFTARFRSRLLEKRYGELGKKPHMAAPDEDIVTNLNR